MKTINVLKTIENVFFSNVWAILFPIKINNKHFKNTNF